MTEGSSRNCIIYWGCLVKADKASSLEISFADDLHILERTVLVEQYWGQCRRMCSNVFSISWQQGAELETGFWQKINFEFWMIYFGYI